ncbi:Uncharacterised protein [Mycobacteroides abscessus subsp. massiliense]|nr:Uncharacterised protein [Mycobacteroides abscessus subsp. massiliense]
MATGVVGFQCAERCFVLPVVSMPNYGTQIPTETILLCRTADHRTVITDGKCYYR